MSTALTYLFSFLATVAILVVFHELGHYWAARICKVKILKFSVGFGRVLWSRRVGPDQTEWAIAAVPLGGYVKMLDEREEDVAAKDLPRAFNRQSVWRRIFIVGAGPVANFVLAILFFWLLFVTGVPGEKPVTAEPVRNTPAALAGIANGDTFVAINDEPVQTWGDVNWRLLKEAVNRSKVRVEVIEASGRRGYRTLDLSGTTADDVDGSLLNKLGLRPYVLRSPAVLGSVLPDRAGARAGLQPGDRVVGVNGTPVATWVEFTTIVRANAEKPLKLDVERRGARLEITATPDADGKGKSRIGLLGVGVSEELKREAASMRTTVSYDALTALPKAAYKVWDLSVFSLKLLWRMITGEVSWKNLSGPITIADYAGQSAQAGWVTFLTFLAFVSVSLGVLNLLPIPLLDGGHLVYYFAEIVKGSPVSERTMEIGQRVGLALLLGLTFFAFYNDINRLFTG
ncbi:Regulator of sigma-E protease RseP [Usitatibacter rugosus]|uniref:Zinc metalloprotease n=1 Tax=Usitatibacter rugosus TaxID=2732067 RepID=A0A6M4GSB7_9PROT|nr:RIP metalloprotease RseP [Usitatibacter rugosus]QJR09986.1 Regulator of sigma-E protease RseP [Usitatibacter rugosus]